MKLNQLSLSVSADEITRAVKTAVERATQVNAQVPPELASLAINVKGENLIISMKKKIGFIPMTISGTVGLRPAPDGEGIVITLAKVSAGFVGSEAIAAQMLSQISSTLSQVPGCTVSGNDIMLSKEALAEKLPWLSVPGRISRFGIEGDTLEIAVG